jgi:hypothetical protein
MPTLTSLFQSGEAAFVANVGPMIEPVTQADFLGKSGVKKKFPPSLFAHNVQQVKQDKCKMRRDCVLCLYNYLLYQLAIQNLDPLNLVAKGVLGRAVTALQAVTPSPYTAAMYSIAGCNMFNVL